MRGRCWFRWTWAGAETMFPSSGGRLSGRGSWGLSPDPTSLVPQRSLYVPGPLQLGPGRD